MSKRALSAVYIPRQQTSRDVRVAELAIAIARAEHGNTIPPTFARNNPGNIRSTVAPYPIATYPTIEAGWDALYALVDRVADGRSTSYSPSMTWREFAWMYVAGTQPGGEVVSANDKPDVWASYVAGNIGVDVMSTIGEYFA